MDLKTFIELKKDIKKNDIEGQKKLYKKARQENLFRVKLSDFIVKIPMLTNFNSLNVSNAAAIILFEAVKQKLSTESKKRG